MKALDQNTNIRIDINHVVEHLASIQEVSKIWLFGGAAKGRQLDFRSDIDFAVEGLPEDIFYRTWSQLDEKTHFPLDLIRFEATGSVLKNEILSWGELVYERKS